jgi:ArsR family transcriptional regulator
MTVRAAQASALLKALSHEGRLMILCHLSTGEKSVTELERLLGQRQAAVSQQLARLRADGLVQARREGKAIFYSLGDPRAGQVVGLLYEMFCRC